MTTSGWSGRKIWDVGTSIGLENKDLDIVFELIRCGICVLEQAVDFTEYVISLLNMDRWKTSSLGTHPSFFF